MTESGCLGTYMAWVSMHFRENHWKIRGTRKKSPRCRTIRGRLVHQQWVTLLEVAIQRFSDVTSTSGSVEIGHRYRSLPTLTTLTNLGRLLQKIMEQNGKKNHGTELCTKRRPVAFSYGRSLVSVSDTNSELLLNQDKNIHLLHPAPQTSLPHLEKALIRLDAEHGQSSWVCFIALLWKKSLVLVTFIQNIPRKLAGAVVDVLFLRLEDFGGTKRTPLAKTSRDSMILSIILQISWVSFPDHDACPSKFRENGGAGISNNFQ